MSDGRLNGGSGCQTFVVKDTILEKYNGNDEYVRLPGFVFIVGSGSFRDNQTVKEVSLSSTAKRICALAFSKCKALNRVELPYDLTEIGDFAFSNCVSLREIVFKGVKERWREVKKGEKWFEGTGEFVISCKDGVITKQEEIESESSVDFNSLKREVLKESQEKSTEDERREDFERRRELIKRMSLFSDDSEDEDDDEDSDDNEEIDEEELRFKALKICIERNMASVSLFQRTFPIGYIRACNLIDWMESRGYVSVNTGSRPRKVLITEEEFNKLYSEPSLVDDEEFNDEEDRKFAEYEKYLRKHFPDCDDDEEEVNKEYDKLIEQIFSILTQDSDAPLIELAKRNEAAQNLVNVLSQIIAKKSAPISASIMPMHPSWDNEDEFNKCVMDRLEQLIKSDKRMGLKGAVKKAENYLEAVRDTHDR